MTKFNIARAFDHKTHGRIGLVNLEADVKTVTVDGKELPASSVEYLLTFALQNLQDAYAGADSAAEATARFEKKLARLIEGSIGVRESGDGASLEVRTIRTVLGKMLREAGKWKELTEGKDEAERAALLDTIYAKQPEAKKAAILAIAQDQIKEAEVRKAQAKEMASGLTL